MTVKEASEKWEISIRRIQTLCKEGKITGVIKFGKVWAIPRDSIRPSDGRLKNGEYKAWRKTKPKGK